MPVIMHKHDLSNTQRVQAALVSDTHGKLDDRIATLVSQCDIAIHAGDIGAAGIVGELQPRSGTVIAIRGNNDVPAKWKEMGLMVLNRLPDLATIFLPGGQLTVVHGHRHNPAKQRHSILRRRFNDARAVLYGHSHRLVIDDEENPWVLNPGAAGRNRTHGGPSCLLLTATRDDWRITARRFDPAPPSL